MPDDATVFGPPRESDAAYEAATDAWNKAKAKYAKKKDPSLADRKAFRAAKMEMVEARDAWRQRNPTGQDGRPQRNG